MYETKLIYKRIVELKKMLIVHSEEVGDSKCASLCETAGELLESLEYAFAQQLVAH